MVRRATLGRHASADLERREGVHEPTAACRLRHTTHLRIFIDPDLLQHPEVWAAAGTWNDVFGIEPHQLVEASDGMVADLKKG